MADYWKSNPRKFCDFCKCWFADNKSSKEFHERGKRHKENVEKKIGQLRKKGQQQYETQQELSGYLKQMEEGAMQAFKKDVASNPNLIPEYKVAIVEDSVRKSEEQTTSLPGNRYQPGQSVATTSSPANTASDTPKPQGQNEWVEALGPEGHTYYWNTVTGASQWTKPENFTPVASTSSTSSKAAESNSKETKVEEKKTKDMAHEESGDDEAEEKPPRGEKRRSDAYGGWSSVSTEPEETPDLQLPEANSLYMSLYVPQAVQYEPREKLVFKEKTVGSIGGGSAEGSSGVPFKKRKAGGRQIRSRDTTS